MELGRLTEETGIRFAVGEYTTVGGFLTSLAGRIPAAGESFDVPGASLRAERVSERAILEVRVRRVPVEGGAAGRGRGGIGMSAAGPREEPMTGDRLKKLLAAVAGGGLSVEEAFERLRSLPYENVGDACVDHHRGIRQGIPEVIFGEGKTTEQIVAIARSMRRAGTGVLITRLSEEKIRAIRRRFRGAVVHAKARCVVIPQGKAEATREGVRPHRDGGHLRHPGGGGGGGDRRDHGQRGGAALRRRRRRHPPAAAQHGKPAAAGPRHHRGRRDGGRARQRGRRAGRQAR